MPFFARKYALSFFVILASIITGIQWGNLPLANTTIVWLINFATVYCILIYKRYYFHPQNKNDYLILQLYLAWFFIGVIRGVFVAENYWDWKNLFVGTFALSLPLFIYAFSQPLVLKVTLSTWIRYALPFFFFFFFFFPPGAYHFYLGPVLLLSCFLPIVPIKWRYLFICLLTLMMIADLGARSQVIKAAMALTMSVVYFVGNYISDKILKFLHWFLYIIPIVFLVLGTMGVFNVFEEMNSDDEQYQQKTVKDGQVVEQNLSADTRTGLYEEVIVSAVKHNYIICGRTLARGNDSELFGTYGAEVLKIGRYERYSNEVCFLNVFTWLGMIGVVLLSLIYLTSSYLAVFKSNNLYMKLMGIMIAFRWLYGWVEDSYSYSPMSIALWMMIAMGFSLDFRKMSNIQFELYIKSIFR